MGNWPYRFRRFLFSALITGIAIVHTTGMPVAYSFELGNSINVHRACIQILGSVHDLGLPALDREGIADDDRAGIELSLQFWPQPFHSSGIEIADHGRGALGVPMNILLGWYSRPEWIQTVLHYGYVVVMFFLWKIAGTRRTVEVDVRGTTA